MAAKSTITVKSVTSGGKKTTYITAGNGADVINATSLFGSITGDFWEITAGNGADTVNGSDHAERIWGDSSNNTDTSANGADILNGGGGNDVINGGNGADIISGDRGADILFGDRGGDTFKYKLVSDSNAQAGGAWSAETGDWIKDFRASEGDKIDLTSLNGQLVGGPDMLQASGGASAYGVWVGVEGGYSYVYADTNGDSVADVAIRVTGGVGLSNISGLNYAPTAADDVLAVDEDQQVGGSVATNDVDPDGHTLSYQQVGDAPVGFVLNSDGTYTFDTDSYDSLAAGATASFTVNYSVSDGHGGSDSGTLEITVTGTNDAPVLANEIENGASDEDQPVSFTIPADAFSDVDGDELTYSTSELPEWLSFNAETRSFTGTPPVNWNGTVTVTVTASDGYLSASDTFDLVINPVQDAPELTGTPASLAGGTEDTAYTLNLSDLLQGWEDFDGDVLGVTNLSADHATILDNGDGTYTVTPEADYYGTVTISYEVSDGHSGIATTLGFELAAVDDGPTYLSPAIYTGGGDPNDFDHLGNAAGENLSDQGTNGNNIIYGGAVTTPSTAAMVTTSSMAGQTTIS